MMTQDPGQAIGKASHKAQLQTVSILQQLTKICYFLVQANPNYLLTYFTTF